MPHGRGLALAAGSLLAAALPAVAFSADRPGMDERVRCQRAIERVYAGHRTGASPASLPPAAVIERRAADGILKSAALERLWGVTLTGERLQAELDRMAAHSQAPGVLRELWAALGDDPLLAAECLARPALADRLLQSYYAFDQRQHGALRDRARRERAAARTVADLAGGTGRYAQTEWRVGRVPGAGGPAMVDRATFDARVAELRRLVGGAAGAIEVGHPSPVREDESRFSVTAVLALGDDHVRVATIEWRKEPFEAWWARTRSSLSRAASAQPFAYRKPELAPATPCPDDTWRPTLSLLDSRYWHSAVWTGSEMIVFGGMQSVGTYYGDGSRYDPATDTWTLLPAAGAPSPRESHVAVWTGSEMIVWGSTFDGDGALYDPVADSWRPMSTFNAPAGRSEAVAVWTGTEMIIWGGNMTNTGGRYNPATDTWTPTAPSPLAARAEHTAVWTGSRMIVWGGYNGFIGVMYGDGASYDPVTNTWTSIALAGAPNKRYWHDAVWTGTEMIVWGGVNYPTYDLSGGRYNPVTDTWTPTSLAGAPSLRWMHKAVWTGTEMIVQGGTPVNAVGGRYNPATDTWTPTSPVNAATNGQGITAVWTGTEMIVWGGLDDDFMFANYGARYDPAADAWHRTTTMNVPSPRGLHSAAWTGSEMVIWGGFDGSFTNTGGLYDTATDTWRKTSVIGAPAGRENATTVWTGQEAIFWGGDPDQPTGTGGRYDPAADAWTLVSTTNAPLDRYGHTAVWTGSEMIVFGGVVPDPDARRYRPATDTWVDANPVGSPGERDHHAAVWTGSEMVVWGGFIWNGTTPTGGRYNPATDSWRATNVPASPPTRMWPIGEWTGTEMIVWGGFDWLMNEDLDDGGRYDPVADTWTPTSLVGAPSPRVGQGVWTGLELVLWGGAGDRSGGRYDPAADAWRPTSLVGAPHVRGGGRWSTVWTGTEMIVWGGIIETQKGTRYCASAIPLPDIFVTPDPVEFGVVLVGQTADRVLTVRNDGSAPLTVTAVVPPAAPFALTSDGCTGSTLPPTGSCAVAARFAPTAPGPFAGSIVIASNDPDEPQVTVPLNGTGAVLSLQPATFGLQDGGNGVWEPGEAAAIVTSWANGGTLLAPGVTGTFTAPAGIAFTDDTAAYGDIPAGATRSCVDGGDCADARPIGPRPATHWDALLPETVSTGQSHVWPLHVGDSFVDVVPADPYYRFVETVLHRAVTGGCAADRYCPQSTTTREQMAVFVLVAKEGPAFAPPPCTPGLEMFPDVPAASPFCSWIEELARRGVAGGCGGGSFCPTSAITREQMAVFLLRVLDPTLSPPPCVAPMFGDVPASSPFCRWVEELARRGVTGGCSAAPPLYCPTAPVTRGAMAVFCTTTFDLRLYGP